MIPDIYTRIIFKCKNEMYDLTGQEREHLEKWLAEQYVETVSKWDDEKLMQEADEKGYVI